MDRRLTLITFLIITACGPVGPGPMDDAGPGSDAFVAHMDGSPGTDANVHMDGGPGSDAFVQPDTGPLGCTGDSQCDDHVDCTIDTCHSGSCSHVVTPALCAAGESCNPTTGCAMGHVCATNGDCADTDPCTTMEMCDPAARVCTFVPLDGDHDGDPPRVCGGGDCDDSLAAVHAGATEACNNRDDNCNGSIDDGADTACGVRHLCSAGSCTCQPAYMDCFGSCVDLMSDSAHCGSCTQSCGASGTCSGGTCMCPSGQTFCGADSCVDTAITPSHCGSCAHACAADQDCHTGSCVTCDSAGSPCCGGPSGHCATGFNCTAGACASCGGVGQPCCTAGSPACDSGECTSGTCTACGAPGQPCCGGFGCDRHSAQWSECSAGTCVACGGPGQLCCYDDGSGRFCEFAPWCPASGSCP